jgi:hypothetical protein
MHSALDFFPDRRTEIFDLFLGNRSPDSIAAYEAKHAWGSQYPQALFGRLRDADEGAAAKHGNIHFAPPVAPLADLFNQREKCEHSAFLEM